MKFNEDPRVKEAKKICGISWLFYSVFLVFMMGISYAVGTTPYIFGLPRWVVLGNFVVPVVFVIALIIVAEKFIPDLPLEDKQEKEKGGKQ